MIGKGATPSFFAIANDNYTLTYYQLSTEIKNQFHLSDNFAKCF